MTATCVVFVSNRAYFNLFQQTCAQLRTRGAYTGPICLVIGDDLNDMSTYMHPFIIQHHILVKHFSDLQFPSATLDQMKALNRDSFWFEKRFQYHKLHIFNTFFKQWDTILYMDCGITILEPVAPLFSERQAGRFLAHSDAYPAYEWKLYDQFDIDIDKPDYDLSGDYPQTTLMLYDTAIITDTTFNELYTLTVKYPTSKTNDQGIIALYMSSICKIWTQLPINNDNYYLYDFKRRAHDKPYIAVKRDWNW